VYNNKEIDTAAAIILGWIRTQKNHPKWHTLHAIEKMTGIAHALARLAVTKLRFKSQIEQRRRGRSTVWKYKTATGEGFSNTV